MMTLLQFSIAIAWLCFCFWLISKIYKRFKRYSFDAGDNVIYKTPDSQVWQGRVVSSENGKAIVDFGSKGCEKVDVNKCTLQILK